MIFLSIFDESEKFMNDFKGLSPKIFKKFDVLEKIGSGSFGEVYKVQHHRTNQFFAIKKECTGINQPQLENEIKIIKTIERDPCFPKIYLTFNDIDGQYIVMDFFPNSLENLFQICDCHFSLKTTLMIADQMISALQILHSRCFIHRDLKPENMMIGNMRAPHALVLIDFGLSTSYCDFITKIHIPLREGKSLVGTTRYASINVHNGIEYSRRDDMESLAYILIYFMKGSLPWQNVPLLNGQSLSTRVNEIKQSTPIDELCYDLPDEFGQFLREVRALQFDEEPNYVKYREMFRNLFIRSGYVYDYVFDWAGHENDKAPVREVHVDHAHRYHRQSKSRNVSLSNSYWNLGQQMGTKKHHHNPFKPATLLQMSALNLLTLK